nr:hypothetical protein [Desulfomarina profundi]
MQLFVPLPFYARQQQAEAMMADHNSLQFRPERPTHECGVCGIFNHKDSSKLTYFGLYALQHRGRKVRVLLPLMAKMSTSTRIWGLSPKYFQKRFSRG